MSDHSLGDNVIARVGLLLNPMKEHGHLSVCCYERSVYCSDWRPDGRELVASLEDAVESVGPEVYRGLRERLQEARRIGRLDANRLSLEVSFRKKDLSDAELCRVSMRC